MIKLSDRLNMIAEEIEKGETMADIGTDHGFLPVYLIQKGISPYAVLGDISVPTLEKSRETAREFLNPNQYSCRCGNGFEILKEGEVDVVVIAGMGSKEMCDIIGKDIEKSKSFSKMILQPRKDIGILRYFLYKNGFSIEGEKLVRERKYICEILTVRPKEDSDFWNKMREEPEISIKWEVPEYYLNKGESLDIQLIKRKIKREKNIIKSKSLSKTADDSVNKKNIEYLERIIEGK